MSSRGVTQDKKDRSADDVMEALQELVEEAEAIIADSARPAANNRMKDLRESIDSATRKLQNGYGMAQETVRKSARGADRAIRNNPYQSLAAGIGLGLLAGFLFNRK